MADRATAVVHAAPATLPEDFRLIRMIHGIVRDRTAADARAVRPTIPMVRYWELAVVSFRASSGRVLRAGRVPRVKLAERVRLKNRRRLSLKDPPEPFKKRRRWRRRRTIRGIWSPRAFLSATRFVTRASEPERCFPLREVENRRWRRYVSAPGPLSGSCSVLLLWRRHRWGVDVMSRGSAVWTGASSPFSTPFPVPPLLLVSIK